jgi:hypothetical protein
LIKYIDVSAKKQNIFQVFDQIEGAVCSHAQTRACTSGWLRKVRNGLFLNAACNQSVSVAAAAGSIKQTAAPSLAWVLEQFPRTTLACVQTGSAGGAALAIQPFRASPVHVRTSSIWTNGSGPNGGMPATLR